MPNFSKDETANDAYMLFAAEAREYDDGTNTRDVMLLTLQYAESPRSVCAKGFQCSQILLSQIQGRANSEVNSRNRAEQRQNMG
jgi:hypothetical protein